MSGREGAKEGGREGGRTALRRKVKVLDISVRIERKKREECRIYIREEIPWICNVNTIFSSVLHLNGLKYWDARPLPLQGLLMPLPSNT